MSDVITITEKAGCSGNSYKLDLVSESDGKDDLIEQHGVKVFVDPLAFMYIFGTTMDWEDGDFHSGFTFVNPNEKGRCGCGESFHI
jgi:iron-sulfur cluster assembly protein